MADLSVAMSSESATRAGLAALAALRQRQTWVLAHRWVGLVMALFLIVAGVTGSLLAFYDELEVLVSPRLHLVEPPAPGAQALDPITLRERAQALVPDAWVHHVVWPTEADRSMRFRLEGPTDSVAKVHAELPDNQLFLNPYTGEETGRRYSGDLTQGWINLMPFIYRLHYSLALGTVGNYAFGIIALLWTLDCFVGVFLTLPRRKSPSPQPLSRARERGFLARWKPAWVLKRSRLNFDLHRAFSLWTWAMLFVLAWSSVALNLNEVYQPVTRALFGMQQRPVLPSLPVDQPEPGLGWAAGYARGKALMAAEVARRKLEVQREDSLDYDPHRAEFTYWMTTRLQSSGAASDWIGVIYDANTGAQRDAYVYYGSEQTGDVITRWRYDLHMARIWGLPFRIFVCVMGAVVTMLTVTGLVIWWRKRRARGLRSQRELARA